MATQQNTATIWVQTLVNNDAIAIPAPQIREMVMLDNAVSRPMATPEVRGILNLRGRVLTLLDLRVMLGQRSAVTEVDELCAMLTQRKGDHERWVDELASSIRDSVPFTMARDPTKCAFGAWQASFQTENAVLRMQLAKLDSPHRAIHALADETLSMAEAGKQTQALERLERARRGTLKELLRLLDESAQILRDEHREIVLVLDRPGRGLGVLVDSVVGVRRIEPSQIEMAQPGALGDIEHALLGMSEIEGRMHLLLDVERMLDKRDSEERPLRA